MSRKRRARRRPAPWWRRHPGTASLAATVVAAAFVIATLVGRSGGEGAIDPDVLAVGATFYADTCGSCHGAGGEGFARADVPAPPLDGSAHSWHHSDDQIVALIVGGGTRMPAVGATWTEAEIEAVLAYVKSRWEPWQRDAQPGTIGE